MKADVNLGFSLDLLDMEGFVVPPPPPYIGRTSVGGQSVNGGT